MSQTSSDKLTGLQQRETEIGALRTHPAYQQLREKLNQQENDYWDRFTRDARKGVDRDPFDTAVKREAFRLAKEILAEPDDIERKLQNELRKQHERSPS